MDAPKKILFVKDLPGLGPASIEKLELAGYTDLMTLATANVSDLAVLTELSEATIKKVLLLAKQNLDVSFETGEAALERRNKVQRITTGSQELDKLLCGGFETGSISEAFGMYSAGKTCIGHVLAVRCQLPVEKGGLDGECVYIDTENTFRPERIKSIANALKLDAIPILQGIRVARAFNSSHQMLLAQKVEDLIKRGVNVRLIIVDSLTAHFRAEYVGRGTLADRQQHLNTHMHQLLKVAELYNICVYVSNQVMARPDTFFGDPIEAIGGNIVSHNSCTRIYLRRGRKGCRVAKIVDSPNMAESEASFMVCEEGIKDA